MKNLSFITILLGFLTFVVLFQNCGKSPVNFQAPLSSIDGGNSIVVIPDDEEVRTTTPPIVNPPVSPPVDTGSTNYACILEGPGKSLKLAYNHIDLFSQTMATKSLCLTKYGCENIAAQKFKVKEAIYRGYCKNNVAQTVSLSDGELQAIIDSL